MSVAPTHSGRHGIAVLRVWLLVLAALLFGQFTAVSHAHSDHDETPATCDVCIMAVSEDEDDTIKFDDEPQPDDPSLEAIPASLMLKDDPSVPAFVMTHAVPVMSDRGRTQPRQTRAPPL